MAKRRPTATCKINQEQFAQLLSHYPGGQSALAENSDLGRTKISELLNRNPYTKWTTAKDLAVTLSVGLHDLVEATLRGHDANGEPILEPYTQSSLLKEMWPGLGGEGSLKSAMTRLLAQHDRTIDELHEDPPETVDGSPKVFGLKHIRQFWNWQNARRELPRGAYVKIRGTLSHFAPVVVGRPSGKRMLHHSFRRQCDSGHMAKELLHSNMAITAGQMVWNVGQARNFRVLGLYQSIVRNSVLVFVSEQYFNEFVAKAFIKERGSAIEAELVGRVYPIRGFASVVDVSNWRSKINEYDMDPTPPALFIEGPSGEIAPRTKITYLDDSRYLDGDIFTLIRHDDSYRFATRFLDLSDPQDVSHEQEALKDDIAREFGAAKIVCNSEDLNELRTD